MISNVTLVRAQLLVRPNVYHATKQDREVLERLTERELNGASSEDEDEVATQANYMETVEIENASMDSSSISEFEFEENDVPILLCRSADVGYVDMVVFNRGGDFYLHHNYELPFLPMSSLACSKVATRNGAFLVVCGTSSEIEIFDLNELDSIKPVAQLGGSKRILDKNGKKRTISLPNSHTGSIISLDVSQLHENVLASAGEDGVKLWDLLTLNFLADVRQGCCSEVRWHESAPETLLTCGLADRTLMIHEFQTNENYQIYKHDADFEQVEWLGELVLFTDENGCIGVVDPKKRELMQKMQLFGEFEKKPLTALAVHNSEKLIVAASPEVPKIGVLRVTGAGLELIGYYDFAAAFSATFLPDEDAFACVLGHGDGNVSIFQVYSRIGVDNIKELVEDPQQYMQMKDITLFIDGFDREPDLE